MCGIFSISLHRSVICASPNPSFDQNQPWWRSATGRCSDDVASQRANTALIDQGGDARRCDELIDEARRTAVVIPHLKPSRDQVTGDLLRTPGASSALLSRIDARVARSTRQYCRGVKRMRVSRRAGAFFSLAASYRSGKDGGPLGSKWSSARPEARRKGGSAAR
jgi:SH3-like domain-containing protein